MSQILGKSSANAQMAYRFLIASPSQTKPKPVPLDPSQSGRAQQRERPCQASPDTSRRMQVPARAAASRRRMEPRGTAYIRAASALAGASGVFFATSGQSSVALRHLLLPVWLASAVPTATESL